MTKSNAIKLAVQDCLRAQRTFPLGPMSTATLACAAAMAPLVASAVELPVPCIAGICASNGPATWVTSGTATYTSVGGNFNINQTSDRATFNWQSFNISADGTVNFIQPNASSVALNKIFQGDPVRILGALNANGIVYLINRNGILFGQGAQVNVGGLVASSLDITTPAALDGLLEAVKQGKPAFGAFVDPTTNQVLTSGTVHVARGASINSDKGQIMLFGSEVLNEGTLTAPGGQIILAAGDSVYLAPSDTDTPFLRGLLVEVGKGGTVTNAAASAPDSHDAGNIRADRGNVTLVGLMVNQNGRVSATTSVREIGSIRLLAHDGASVQGAGPGAELRFANEGTLKLAAGSVTEVQLDSDTTKTVDATTQLRSVIALEGRSIALQEGSTVSAPSGAVTIKALTNPDAPAKNFPTGDGRLVIEKNAVIDVSGATINKSMESNVLAVELRGSQLANSPQQRTGALRGDTVYVDIRQSGVRADGTSWVGSPIGDLQGDISTINKDVTERSLTGGTISIVSDNAVLAYAGSNLNISGGSIHYQSGFVNTTQLLGADGKVYDIGTADRDRQYKGLVGSFSVAHPKWGITEKFNSNALASNGHFEQGYVEGKDAGTISIVAPHIALEGSIQADVAISRNQRQLPTSIPEGMLYRPYNQLPQSGSLILGNSLGAISEENTPNYVLGKVNFAFDSILGQLTNVDGSVFNPLVDPLPASLDVLRLRPDLLGLNRVGHLAVFSNELVTLPENILLSLPSAGSIELTAAAVDIEGGIVAQSGSINATARSTLTEAPTPGNTYLKLGSGARIDVAGRWINDLPSNQAVPSTDTLAINGGSVSLSAQRGASFTLAAGSVIDVSAGAQRAASGTIKAGSGGSISLSVGATRDVNQPAAAVAINADLRAFALSNGGKLSITANSICIAAVDCAVNELGQQTLGQLWLPTNIYANSGFSSLNFATNVGGLDVAADTFIQPRQFNYQLNQDPANVASGARLSSLASVGILPDFLRKPVSLSLTNNPKVFAEALDAATFNHLGILRIGHDATIDLDPGASLALSSFTSIVIDGRLSAPAGNITVGITSGGTAVSEFIPNQGIWLEGDAIVSAAGTAKVTTNDLGYRRGSVLDGGVISLDAKHGYIVTAPTSMIDVSGTTTFLNVGLPATSNPAPLQKVASSGGLVKLSAVEGILMNGNLRAQGGDAPGTAGGSLRLQLLDSQLRGLEPPGAAVPIFPINAHDIRLGDYSPVVVGANRPIPLQYNGVAMVPVDRVNAGGFSSLDFSAFLLADDIVSLENTPVSKITFSQSTKLSAAASITLNAPQIFAAPNARIDLAAAYVGLGQDDTKASSQSGATTTSGSAIFDVKADLIEFIGNLGLNGFASANFQSGGDIRFRGVQTLAVVGAPIKGVLNVTGDLTFTAQQLYPTTLSQFSVNTNGVGNTLTIARSGGTPGDILSAGGQLSFNANEIAQQGVVRAPFGSLSMKANNITLADGSVTSTSGAGALVPFGTTQAGSDWVYQLPSTDLALFTASGPPAQKLTLDADNVNIRNGATVDISGGGDLQAYEFMPGTGGSSDILSNANPYAVGQFAIVPTLNLKFSPFDSSEQVGFGYKVGDSIHLAGSDGLLAGDYAILPARYALLPGAYLIRPVSGYTDIAEGTTFSRLDGGTIVSGYQFLAGTAIRNSRSSGFAVYSGAAVQNFATYHLSRADDYFSALAKDAGTAAQRLPQDSGQLQLIAGAQLAFAGQLRSASGSGGRGAQVDISADKLELVNGSGASIDPTFVALDVGQLNALGAESLLIGGLRSNDKGTVTLTTTAANVVLDAGVELKGRDLLLAASEELTLRSGARVEASGDAATAPEKIALDKSGALLRVSSGAQAGKVERTNSTVAGGKLTLEAGSALAAKGSALIEASGDVSAQADYELQGGSLAFSVARLSLGAPSESVSGVVLSPDKLSALNLQQLMLTSASTIDIYGSTTLAAAGELQLDAQGLRAMTTDAAAQMQARTLRIGNSRSTSTVVAGAQSLNGTVNMNAEQTVLTSGEFAIAGFVGAHIASASELHVQGSGKMHIDGTAVITAPLITTSDGIDFNLSATGAMQVNAPSQVIPSTNVSVGIGGKLALEATRVAVATEFKMPSGIVSIIAKGADVADSVTLSAGTIIDVAGTAKVFDDQLVAAPGGKVKLESQSGDVVVANSSIIDVSSAAGANSAGSIGVVAKNVAVLDGDLRGNGGGAVSVDAAKLPNLAQLNARLNNSGFTSARSFRQRGVGDLVIAADPASAINAHDVKIAADGGALTVLGDINASGKTGGSILLTARDQVTLAGTIDASAKDAGEEGGTVRFASDREGVTLTDTARVNVAGGTDGKGGTVHVRVPRDALLSVTDGDAANDKVRLGQNIRGADQLVLEGFKRYTQVDGVMDSSGVLLPLTVTTSAANRPYADAATFMQSASSVLAGLGRTGDATAQVLPGVEIDSVGDMTLNNDWNLASWRFDNAPGVLTLRAGGNLNFNKSLSDGFAAVTGADAFVLSATPSPSWSYQLVAGADFGASDAMQVDRFSNRTGDVVIAAGAISNNVSAPTPTMVRTGTGDIDIAASGDLVLKNRASVIYTAGANSQRGIALPKLGTNLQYYPDHGGDININVAGDILGAPTNQLGNAWLWRTGQVVGVSRPSPTGWNVSYQWFEGNVGALAGGNINVNAGGNISDFSTSIATIGRQIGDATSAARSVVDITGGGRLNVQSGGSITGGMYYVGRGSAVISAADRIGADTVVKDALAPILQVSGANFSLTARNDLQIETALDPFLLPQGRSQGIAPLTASYFSTYTNDSAVNLLSLAGNVSLQNRTQVLINTLTYAGGVKAFDALQVYPGSLRATAYSGDFVLPFDVVLWPSAIGQLELFANGDIDLSRGTIMMSDIDPTTVFAITRPQKDPFANNSVGGSVLKIPDNGVFHVPLHSAASRADGQDDPNPARVVALQGDVIGNSSKLFDLPKPITVISGRDIINFGATVQHLNNSRLSRLSAGRDIRYTSGRASGSGRLEINNDQIRVDGPGALLLEAGRTINLGASAGVSTTGNQKNPALPDEGADISLLAGLNGKQPNYTAFADRYLQPAPEVTDVVKYVQAITGEKNLTAEQAQTRLAQFENYSAELITYVKRESGLADVIAAQALTLFEQYSPAKQRAFIEGIFFAELRASGRSAAQVGNGNADFSRGFTALQTLYPGSNPNAATGETNAYKGDISLLFSRVYTLAGGDISLLAPGGAINVGLATPPAAFGIDKKPFELGIVAQSTGSISAMSFGDFLVNESRVFAADGGDILVWSTESDIDAGRGAKTAISAPPATTTFNQNGTPKTVFPVAIAGSGIQTQATIKAVTRGDVDLFAPHGVVNAGDAGIVAGNLTIAATAVLGADNIKVSGVSVGVPVDTGALGASIPSSGPAPGTNDPSKMALDASGKKEEKNAPQADTALSWLEVFVMGLGEDNCKQDDIECLKKQKTN